MRYVYIALACFVGSLIGQGIGALYARRMLYAWYRFRDRKLPEPLRRV